MAEWQSPISPWQEHGNIQGTLGERRANRRFPGTTYFPAVPEAMSLRSPQIDRDAQSAAEEATQELIRFDAEMGSRASTFSSVFLRLEAASSTQINDAIVSAQTIFGAELGVHTDSSESDLVAATTRALQTSIKLSRNVTAETITRVHAVLMEGNPQHKPVRWREEAAWVDPRRERPVGITFVAPEHSQVAGLIDNLIAFAELSETQALVSVAIAHAQFEAIRPFSSDNGLISRALTQTLLRNRGVTRSVIVPFSSGLIGTLEQYRSALIAHREGDLSAIVHTFAAAALRAVSNARRLVAELDAIRSGWDTRLTVRKDSNAWKLLDILLRRPILDSATASRELEIKQPNVYPPLRALIKAGIVQSNTEHRLGPYWHSDEVLTAVDQFLTSTAERDNSRADRERHAEHASHTVLANH